MYEKGDLGLAHAIAQYARGSDEMMLSLMLKPSACIPTRVFRASVQTRKNARQIGVADGHSDKRLTYGFGHVTSLPCHSSGSTGPSHRRS